MKTIFEIVIGVFAGYCCCYFIANKTIQMTPEEVLSKYLEMELERLKNSKRRIKMEENIIRQGDIRKSIENKYKNLQQLEDYENLLEYLNDEGKGHWWKITTSRKEISIITGETRDKFIMFISDEIFRIRKDLGIKD